MSDRQRRKHTRPNRSKDSHNTVGLVPNIAPDSPGETVPAAVRLSPADKAFLQELPEGLSYHIRQAVRAYVAQMRGE